MRTSRLSFVQGISVGVLGAVCLLAATPLPAADSARPPIIPYPKFHAWGAGTIPLDPGSPGFLIADGTSGKIQLAADLIDTEIRRLSAGKAPLKRAPPSGSIPEGPCVYLVDWRQDSGAKPRLAALLDEEDRSVLSDRAQTGQAYVIRVSPGRKEIWLAGSSDQGVLYAATTFVQMLDSTRGLQVAAAHIRDSPDFRYRAASDWLLHAEANRWAYDWGDGRRAFVRRIKHKLDFCLRFKINMVVFDGFGWVNERVPGYAQLMREVNRYARQRGIKLMYGGYGSNYQPALIRPEHNIGRIWYNRESYPHGKTYACFGEGNPTYREGSPTGALLGGCRGNDELNSLKAQELRDFVRAVEPGAVYIHHEDVGNLTRMGNFGDTNNQLADWKTRCPRCRAKWPNDDFLAADGGAGAIAHGYRSLIEAVCSVKSDETGYDACRDCTIVLVSPGYSPSATDPESWEKHLVFWSNVVSLLPKEGNIEIGFREVFPQEGTGKRWLEAYHERLKAKGRSVPAFLFFVGGADLYSASSFNYPYSAVAALNGLFLGAETIFNFSGAVFQEPLQMLNGEFAWNARAPGHRIPQTHREALARWRELMDNRGIPEEIAGSGGLLAEACAKLYGRNAGAAMLRYFNHFKPQPRMEGELLVPLMPAKLYPTPILWRILQMDRDWASMPADRDSQRWMDKLRLSPAGWQERWMRLWQLYGEVNGGAAQIVDTTLQSSDLRADAREDVVYLKKCLAVARQFSLLLASYHQTLSKLASNDARSTQVSVKETRERVSSLSGYLQKEFSFDTVDPLGGDQASWLEALLYLRNQLVDVAHR